MASVTYEQLVGFHLGWRWQRLAEAAIGFGTAGALVGFFVVIATLAHQAVSSYLGADSVWANRPLLTFTFALLVALPLSSLDNLHSLRFSSLLSLVSVVAVAALIVYRCAQCLNSVDNSYCARGALPAHEWAVHSWSVIRALPLCVFAFGCHLQGVSCFFELRPELRSRRVFCTVTLAVGGICATVYAACGIFGYVLFGAHVDGNVLLSFAATDAPAAAVKLAMAVHIALAAPVVVYPTRTMVRRLALFMAAWCAESWSSTASQPPLEDEDVVRPVLETRGAGTPAAPLLHHVVAPAGSRTIDGKGDHGSGNDDASGGVRVACCAGRCSCAVANVVQAACVCAAAAALAVVAPQVQIVFGLVGATAGIALTALIPGALMLFRIGSDAEMSDVPGDGVCDRTARRAIAYAVIALSVCIGVAGTVLAVIDM